METLCVLEVQKKPTPATLGYQASSISEDHQTGSNQSEWPTELCINFIIVWTNYVANL